MSEMTRERAEAAAKAFRHKFPGCCKEVDSAGVCMAPACTYGEILRVLHFAADAADTLDERSFDAGRRWVMEQVFALHEDTIEKYHDTAQKDSEGKPGAFARGRCAEAKGIARAIGDVVHSIPYCAAIAKE